MKQQILFKVNVEILDCNDSTVRIPMGTKLNIHHVGSDILFTYKTRQFCIDIVQANLMMDLEYIEFVSDECFVCVPDDSELIHISLDQLILDVEVNWRG